MINYMHPVVSCSENYGYLATFRQEDHDKYITDNRKFQERSFVLVRVYSFATLTRDFGPCGSSIAYMVQYTCIILLMELYRVDIVKCM